MEPLVYIIAIMGCADDGSTCQRERIVPATYTTATACEAAMPSALQSNTDLLYPTISAMCEQTREQSAQRQIAEQAARG